MLQQNLKKLQQVSKRIHFQGKQLCHVHYLLLFLFTVNFYMKNTPLDKWMDNLRFYVLLNNSISVQLGR